MNLKVYIICVAVAVLFAVPAVAGNTATIHGEVYGWDTFEPLKNAVVEVNSTPSQSMVAKYGLYSFALEPGDYLIKASYYQNSTLVYSAQESIKIKSEGSYVLDLLLLPIYPEELMDNSERAETSTNQEDPESSSIIMQTAGSKSNAADNPDINNSTADNTSLTGTGGINGSASSIRYYFLAALVLSFLLAGGYIFQKHTKNMEKNRVNDTPEYDEPENSKLEGRQPETDKPEKSRLLEEKTEHNTGKTSAPGNTLDFQTNVSGGRVEPKTEKELPPALAETHLSETPHPEEPPEKPIQMPEPAKLSEPEAPVPKKNLPLPADLQQIMDIIRGQGGRITQKDLRSKLKYSEGKVSLMLADLERRELIEKFKRGRGNIIILRDKDR